MRIKGTKVINSRILMPDIYLQLQFYLLWHIFTGKNTGKYSTPMFE
jgi:hypothetical protein